jgi:hypothetical protein
MHKYLCLFHIFIMMVHLKTNAQVIVYFKNKHSFPLKIFNFYY